MSISTIGEITLEEAEREIAYVAHASLNPVPLEGLRSLALEILEPYASGWDLEW